MGLRYEDPNPEREKRMNNVATSIRLVAIAMVLLLVAAACSSTDDGSTASDGSAVPTTTAAASDTTEAAPATSEVPAESVTVTYWHTMSDPETAQLDSVIAAFEAANPGITIEPTRFAYGDLKAALMTGLAAGEGPDTALLDAMWVPEFADLGALERLDGVMPMFGRIGRRTFPGALATNYWNGHYYGLPQNASTQVLLWNKSVFNAAGIAGPPTTLDEFAEVACALSDPDSEKYGFALGGTDFWALAPIFYAMGGKVTNENITTATGWVNGDASVAAFTLLNDLYDKGCLSPNLLGGGTGTADGHATGAYAMITDGPWMVDDYAEDYQGFDVSFALVPSNAQGETSSVVGGEDVVMLTDSDVSDEAWAWMTFLLTVESQKMMTEAGVMPARLELVDDPDMPEYFSVFLEQLQTAQARVPHPGWSDMDNAINDAFQRMLNGGQTPQEALDQAADEIDQLLG